jgi:hypothetical protein
MNGDHHAENWTFIMPGDKLLHAHLDLMPSKDSAAAPGGK